MHGAGRLGATIARLAVDAGHELAGVSVARASSVERLTRSLGTEVPVAVGVAPDPGALDLVWVATPDRAIESAAAELEQAWDLRAATLVHASGAKPSAILRAVAPRAGAVASGHALFAFRPTDTPLDEARRAHWFVEGEPEGAERVEAFLRSTGIAPGRVDPERKELYHAAAVVSSNAIIALLAMAEEWMGQAGVDREKSKAALGALVDSALGSWRQSESTDALTGPVARGDGEVVLAHREALAIHAPNSLPLYDELTRATLKLAQARADAPTEALRALSAALGARPWDESP